MEILATSALRGREDARPLFDQRASRPGPSPPKPLRIGHGRRPRGGADFHVGTLSAEQEPPPTEHRRLQAGRWRTICTVVNERQPVGASRWSAESLRVPAACGIIGPVFLVVYFGTPAVTGWPYAAPRPSS